jgi:histidinol-phosphate phosphatase family protein
MLPAGWPMCPLPSNQLWPGILLDRDGTIIVDHGYVGSVDRVEFIEGAPEAVATFNRPGIPAAVVTNQAGVARGQCGVDDLARVHQQVEARPAGCGAHIDQFLYFPCHPAGIVETFARTSEDRKPGPGMANAAARALNLDLTASWAVGDRPALRGHSDEDPGLIIPVNFSPDGTAGICRRHGEQDSRMIRYVRILTTGITVHGTFYEVQDWLHSRRDHPERTGTALPAVRNRCAYMNSSRAHPPWHNHAVPVHAALKGQEKRLP